jgi:amino acid adenylation domain-containing protein
MLAGLFLDSARRHANRTALVIGKVRYSYADLAERACKIATVLSSCHKVGRDTTCMIVAERTIEGFSSILGALIAGHGYVPVHPLYPVERGIQIAESARPTCLVADSLGTTLAGSIASMNRGIEVAVYATSPPLDVAGSCKIVLWSDIETVSPCAAPVDDDAERLAYIMYTSGSTGRPKGVGIRRKNVNAYLEGFMSLYPLNSGDRCTQFFDFGFDLSVHDMFCTWLAGACLYVPPEGKPLLAQQMVAEHQLTVWFSAPSLASELMRGKRLGPGAMPSLRLAFFCGDILQLDVARRMAEAAPNAQLVNLYGPTEATIAFTHFPLDDMAILNRLGEVPIGHQLPGQHVSVVRNRDQEAMPGEAGEIILTGTQVADGYWEADSQIGKRFLCADSNRKVWSYRTGDMAKMHPTYGLLFRGRNDQQVKIGGYRVEIRDIEIAVERASDARSAVATYSLGGQLGIVAFVEREPDSLIDIERRCAQLLPSYMVPARFVALSPLPANKNGKLDRRKLQELAATLPAIVPTPTGINAVTAERVGPLVIECLNRHRRRGFNPHHIKSDEPIVNYLDSMGFINAMLDIEETLGVSTAKFEHVESAASIIAGILAATFGDPSKQSMGTSGSRTSGQGSPHLFRGLIDVHFDVTRISRIDGKTGRLFYRGYEISELYQERKFLDVAHYLIVGAYASSEKLAEADRLIQEGAESVSALEFPRERVAAIPQTALISAILSLGTFAGTIESLAEPDMIWRKALHAMGFILGAIRLRSCARRSGVKLVGVTREPLSAAAVSSILGRSLSAVECQVAESLFVILAEHGANTGSFVARVAASTGADFFACLSAAASAFGGPRHGGATSAVMKILDGTSDIREVPDVIAESLATSGYVPGFGHRIYRTVDPRIPLLRNLAEMLVNDGRDDAPLRVMDEFVSTLSSRQKFGIYPNVDSYAAVVLKLFGVEADEATAIFAMARTAGWAAHICEQLDNNILIAPSLLYVE